MPTKRLQPEEVRTRPTKRPKCPPDEHPGAIVNRSSRAVPAQMCEGAPETDSCREKVPAYMINAQWSGMAIQLCRRCAVKLALKILELEAL